MQTTRTYYQDPGHGWIKVGLAEILKLGIAAKISRYSYQNGGSVYLEEDCDFYHYAEAMKAAGVEVELQEIHSNNDSHIRNFQSFRG